MKDEGETQVIVERGGSADSHEWFKYNYSTCHDENRFTYPGQRFRYNYKPFPPVLMYLNDIVEQFTACELTVATDRLPAINAIITDFKRRLGWKNVHGIWEDFLDMQLLWRTNNDGNEASRIGSAIRLPIAPTWSWASVQMPVKYEFWPDRRPVFSADVKLDAQSKTVLCLTKPLIQLVVSTSEDGWEDDWGLAERPSQTHSIRDIQVTVDIPAEAEGETLYFIALYWCDTKRADRVEGGGLLLIRSFKVDGAYQRCGVVGVELRRRRPGPLFANEETVSIRIV